MTMINSFYAFTMILCVSFFPIMNLVMRFMLYVSSPYDFPSFMLSPPLPPSCSSFGLLTNATPLVSSLTCIGKPTKPIVAHSSPTATLSCSQDLLISLLFPAQPPHTPSKLIRLTHSNSSFGESRLLIACYSVFVFFLLSCSALGFLRSSYLICLL